MKVERTTDDRTVNRGDCTTPIHTVHLLFPELSPPWRATIVNCEREIQVMVSAPITVTMPCQCCTREALATFYACHDYANRDRLESLPNDIPEIVRQRVVSEIDQAAAAIRDLLKLDEPLRNETPAQRAGLRVRMATAVRRWLYGAEETEEGRSDGSC
jgi:hypothetical protein